MLARQKLWMLAATAAIASSIFGICAAQEKYPNRPVRMIVALGAGSSADTLARLLAETLRQDLKTAFIVENRPGAGGVIGANYVAKADPDGYTLAVFHASVLTAAGAVMHDLPYDPIKDFTPIAMAVSNPLVLAVSANAKWKSLKEFLDDARADQGMRTCGIIGIGTHSQFNLDLLKIASGVRITQVPFSTHGAVITALYGGQIDTASLVWAGLKGQVTAGKLRILAATSKLKDFPEIPTFANAGYPQANLEVFFGIFGPAGLSKEVMDTLVPAFERAIKNPHNAAALDKMGYAVRYEGPQQLAERTEKELALMKKLAVKADVKKE
jgi:tripartite-type tricarboxylate transporter receptor subunit TctC